MKARMTIDESLITVTNSKENDKDLREAINDLKDQVESLTHIVTVMNRNPCRCKSVTDDKDSINI